MVHMGNERNVRGGRGQKSPKRPPIGDVGYEQATELRRLFIGMRLDESTFMSSYGDAVKHCIAIVFGVAANIRKVYMQTGKSDIIGIINDALEYYYNLDLEGEYDE